MRCPSLSLTFNNVQTPQRSDSAKKPKIKLNTSSTPKSANGTPSKKEATSAKQVKAKPKEEKKPKEVKMTEAEKRERKQVCGCCELPIRIKANRHNRKRFSSSDTSSRRAS